MTILPLNTDLTFALFHLFGYLPSERELLKIGVVGSAMSFFMAVIFMSLDDKLSGPHALDASRPLIAVNTSLVVNAMVSKWNRS